MSGIVLVVVLAHDVAFIFEDEDENDDEQTVSSFHSTAQGAANWAVAA
ncbi:MAG: hypothetical protein HY674_00915 [Chloroflexi bacterium]|nr:hypothetical protein [Chloroflexota bacterium]